MSDHYTSFEFVGYDWNPSQKTLSCHYRLDQDESFTETVTFDFPFAKNLNQAALDAAFFGYFMMAGISYYKAALPPQIKLNKNLEKRLSPAQAEFFKKTYYHGLGELFYQNQITPTQPDFPTDNQADTTTPESSELQDSVLVPLGGGKDSLTSVQLLQDAGLTFQTWTVGNYPGLAPSLQTIHGDQWRDQHQSIKRTISPSLIELNKKGAINGHVPISALWAFLSVISALLTNQRYIAFSNEASANQATLTLDGEDINHQYSKTLEFEQDFRNYVTNFIHPDLEYFSLLRPLSELYIAQIFSQKAWSRFKNQFSSCNRNFSQTATGPLTWCGECPKCAFVFLILSPFVPPSELLGVFGKNLFSEPTLDQTWRSLLGLTDHKPFECVGTIEEVKQAFSLAKTYYPEVSQWDDYLELPDNFHYQAWHEHCLLEKFEKVLQSSLNV